MSLKYGILNLTLLFVAFLLLFKDFETWTQPIEGGSERENVKRSENKTEIPTIFENRKESPAPGSDGTIAGKNIFHPERKEFSAPVVPESKPLARPQVILFGVTLAGDYQSASLIQSGKAIKRGEREMTTLRLGEQIGDYKLAKILSDRITLEAPGDTFDILLHDSEMRKKRSSSRPPVSTAGTPTGATPPSRESSARASGQEEPKSMGADREHTIQTRPQRPAASSTPAPTPYSRFRARRVPTAPLTQPSPLAQPQGKEDGAAED